MHLPKSFIRLHLTKWTIYMLTKLRILAPKNQWLVMPHSIESNATKHIIRIVSGCYSLVFYRKHVIYYCNIHDPHTMHTYRYIDIQ